MGNCGCFPDPEAVKAKRKARSLQFSTPDQKKDHTYVIGKVRHNGLMLQFADEKLRGDKQIVQAAVEQNLLALNHASETMRKDHMIVLDAVKKDKDNWKCAEKVLGGHDELEKFVLEYVKQNKLELHYIPAKMRTREIVLEAVKRDGLSLHWAPEECRADRQIVLEAVQRDGRAWQWASPELREDKEVLLEAVRRDELATGHVSTKTDHEATEEDNADLAIWWGAQDLNMDRAIALEFVLKDGKEPSVRCSARTQ